MKRGHDITIRRVLNGFVVRIGCEHIVIQGGTLGIEAAVNKLTKELERYLLQPGEVEKEYYGRFDPNGLDRRVAEEPEAVEGRPVVTPTTISDIRLP